MRCQNRNAQNDNALREAPPVDEAQRGADHPGDDPLHRLPRRRSAKTPFCDKLCPVHHCVREKSLDACADCGQMDSCPTLGRIAANSPFVLDNLRRLREGK